MRSILARVVLIFVGLALPVCGEEKLATPPAAARFDAYFTKGKWEGMAGGAGFFSPVIATGGRPHLDYAVAGGPREGDDECGGESEEKERAGLHGGVGVSREFIGRIRRGRIIRVWS